MQDKIIREDLSTAYHILSKLGMDDLTYTHLSARSGQGNSFYIYPFGLMFSEVTTDNLLHVDLDGNLLEGEEENYNATGYIIHSQIYKARQDINSIFHLHTTAGVAVSAMKKGLLPISQFALHFYDNISYHKYDSLTLVKQQGKDIVSDLGKNNVMFLQNHGTITSGKTIQETMFYTHHLEQACKVQVAIGSFAVEQISEQICKKSNKDLLSFENNLGERDWKALTRMLKK